MIRNFSEQPGWKKRAVVFQEHTTCYIGQWDVRNSLGSSEGKVLLKWCVAGGVCGCGWEEE